MTEVLTRLAELASTDHTDGVLPAELAGYAAECALRELLTHWEDFLRDGVPLSSFLTDIDDVIGCLSTYREAARRLIEEVK